MIRQYTRVDAACLRGLVLAGSMLALYGCSSDPDTDSEEQPAVTPAPTPDPVPVPGPGSSSPISQLPFVDAATNTQLAGEALGQATALGETAALHVRLPPPRNTALSSSLVRIVGETGNPQILFRSDALAQLGAIGTNPGSEFFTAFAQMSEGDLSKVDLDQAEIEAGTFGQTTTESVLFSGRGASARTANPRIDPDLFRPGVLFPVNRCFRRPVSTLAAWGKALFITDPAIVLDPARTWDPCTGAGTQGGVWTFAHLIREMANGSGRTPEQFALEWLSNWLNDYVVNNDTVTARVQMFNQVIQPWATASGVVATLVIDPITGKRRVVLTGPLDLNIAPFRLLAIVNRIDLGATARGGGGYGGSTTSLPVTAGELRFIFNVVQPNPWGAGTEATCGRKLFTTIFEYGVPGTGCASVVAWAKRWSSLLAFPGFTPAYKAQLQAMTQSVVVHGAAPTKGNQNAINQIRTNEIALAGPWELREFTLTAENPPTNTDPPANGPLRPHTVAQTPNDGVFNAGGADPTINAFVTGPVTAGVSLPVVNPLQCAASFTVPYTFLGLSFRGGNAKIPPGHWRANNVTALSPAAQICARFQFSLNTCSGCHQDDSGTNGFPSTNFTHIDVFSSPPVTLSKFLTGGGPGLVFNVPDTQLGAPIWPFADLERRFQRLFDLSHCTTCTRLITTRVAILDQIQQFGPLPIDPGPEASFPFRTGPITDLGVVRRILDLRPQFAGTTRSEPADFVRPVDAFSD